jgi:hypothetical protein
VPAPSDDSFYIPGEWVYQDTRFLWQPGFWTTAYPDWVWVPGCYRWTPAGYYFVTGYWDYPLYYRGLLFAPVWFHRPFWLTPGWFYRPSFVVSLGYDSLFVNPLWSSYYFGNYYAPFYAGRAFYPWYSYGSRFYDPFYAHARWVHRHDAGWLAGLRSSYLAHQSYAQRGPITSARAGSSAGSPRTVLPISQFQNRAHAGTGLSMTQPAHRYNNLQAGVRARFEGATGRSSITSGLPGPRAAPPSIYQGQSTGNGQRSSFYGPLGTSSSAARLDPRLGGGSVRLASPRSSGVNEIWRFHEPRYQPGRSAAPFSSGGRSPGTTHSGGSHGAGRASGGHPAGGHAAASHHSSGGGHGHGHQ